MRMRVLIRREYPNLTEVIEGVLKQVEDDYIRILVDLGYSVMIFRYPDSPVKENLLDNATFYVEYE